MAVSKSESIFLGHTQSDQRKFLVKLLEHLLPTHERVIIPAVGEFTMARCAIEAGWKPEQIETSDISLFSGLLGALFAGRSVREIPFQLAEHHLPALHQVREAEGIRDDTEMPDSLLVAFLMWVMKLIQIRRVPYQRAQAYDLEANVVKHVRRLHQQILAAIPVYKGVHYEHADLRAVLNREYTEKDVVAINPPVFTNGYAKMFDFTGELDFDPDVPEFHWSKEYLPSYMASRESPAPFLWYRYQNTKGLPPAEIVFAKEFNTQRADYWMFTKPELLDDFQHKGAIVAMPRKALRPYRAPIFGPRDEITPESKVTFVTVTKEEALYYRDLWAHKLGNTAAEQYILMLVDGKVFSTMGIMLGDVYRLRSDKVFENYGFTAPSELYPRANRLLMWCITSAEFGRFVRATSSGINRYWEMDGLKTACLSKYRHVKLNTGILPVTKREKLDNGLYKIMYETKFRDDTYADCVKRFLDEEAARDAARKAATVG